MCIRDSLAMSLEEAASRDTSELELDQPLDGELHLEERRQDHARTLDSWKTANRPSGSTLRKRRREKQSQAERAEELEAERLETLRLAAERAETPGVTSKAPPPTRPADAERQEKLRRDAAATGMRIRFPTDQVIDDHRLLTLRSAFPNIEDAMSAVEHQPDLVHSESATSVGLEWLASRVQEVGDSAVAAALAAQPLTNEELGGAVVAAALAAQPLPPPRPAPARRRHRRGDGGRREVREGARDDGLEEGPPLLRVAADRVRREHERLADVLRADVAERAARDDARRAVAERVELERERVRRDLREAVQRHRGLAAHLACAQINQ